MVGGHPSAGELPATDDDELTQIINMGGRRCQTPSETSLAVCQTHQKPQEMNFK